MMEVSQTVNLYITYVEKEGPFLKVWGQTNKNNSIYVEQFLLSNGPQFDLGGGKISVDNLQVGSLVGAKYNDNKYYRARITNVSFLHEGFVEVNFLDFGNKDIVPCGNIRSFQDFPTSFISIPPLASSFVFAEAHCPGGGEWNETIFENISKEIKYREVQCTLLIQATQYFLVKLYINGADLCGILINRGLMQPISLQAQQAVLLSMSMQRPSVPPAQTILPASTAINTYKACTLEPGCQYPVYVSYVNDGPCHFSVQLKQSEEVLVHLMNDINSINLRFLEDVPIPGTICLARCQEDRNICRAVVTNEVDNQFKVFYVDFGNYEVVPLDALYQIPFKFVLPKVMAIRFALAGVEKSTVTIEMQCAFKKFVDNRLLYMKVLPTPTRMAIPKCELWDLETTTSALDVVNRAAQNAYPEPVSLNRGFSQPVKISYVYSCNRFYVQLVNKENELLQLMLDLQASCQTNYSMDPSNIKVGLPCCALFESDQQWYRSQVVEVLGDNVKVRYIDYGNEEEVPSSRLKIIDGEHLTVLRPQAIECCLNGYQNMEEDQERDGFLEELILEGTFTMKVVEMTNKKALVELFDSSNYNIASLLLDKLATAKSQVSPMLVQAGNKIEHRKSASYQNGPKDQNFRNDRKPGRDNRNYDRTNERNDKSWRQDNKDFRNFDKNSNESSNTKDHWRQNNKGFSPNHERYNRDKNRNSSDTHQSWDSTSDNTKPSNNDWEDITPSNNVGFQNNSKGSNDFGRNKGRFDNDKGGWNSTAPKGGGFKKRNDFRKDGSELSSSGSEKSSHRGPRTSSRNDRPKYQNKFDKPRKTSFNATSAIENSWSVSPVIPSIDAVPATATFLSYDVVGTESNVLISWFHNPGHFYCQLADNQTEFKTMMDDIQQFYKSHKPESCVVGSPVIGLFPEDNVLYRAQVLEVIGTQYKVYYVDFGNVSTISKVWPIDRKFINLPAQAIVCSLNEIASSGEQWPDADNFSKYFNKDLFTCRFINKDEEKTYVNLFYDNVDITLLLIKDGLAVSLQQTIPDIEIPLLIGQQFRATIKSINNLSDIIIVIECGVAISCQMHNLTTATETFEDTLKGLLEQTVIVYVDNVIDDKLEVTLYDVEGSKIVIINPDEGAYDTVEPLCPPLILCSTLTGYVSHVTDTSVFIQPTEYAETLPYLLEHLYQCYEEQKQDMPLIPEEGLLYAVHSQDGNWYRAKVLSFDDEQATVTYIDYGNSEDVAFSELRELEDTFLATCTLCVEVHVNVDHASFIDKNVKVIISPGEIGWEGTLEVPEESSATESELAERENTTALITTQVLEKPVQEIPNIQDTVNVQEVANVQDSDIEKIEELAEETNIGIQNGIQVIVSHIDSPNEFYLQLAESLSYIDDLQLHLQEEVLNMPVLETPTAGVLCTAPYSGDQQWYRAEVLDADDDITTVRFVDYGNTDVIDNKTTQIKTLPPHLLSLAVYATRCSLKLGAIDDDWSTNAIDRFEILANSSCVTAEFTDQNEKTNYVELYADGQNIKDILIQENLGVPAELSADSKSTCFVSHLNSPSEFWIQLENCIDELEWVAEQLSGAEKFAELDDLTPGTLCAALFPDDEMWYRARILSNTVAGLELLFIDYGNSCTSTSLRQLPEDLIVTPPLAQKCSLQKPEGILYWSLQAVNKFNEISADGQTIFTVRKISTGETSVVQLLLDEEDVAAMLLPVTQDGCIKDVESVGNFHIEQNGEILPETYELETIPGMTWSEESTDKFKALCSQDAMVFQIEFVSANTVRLYLNGDDIRMSLGGDKVTSLNVSKTNAEDELVEAESDNGVKHSDERNVNKDDSNNDVESNDDEVVRNQVQCRGEDLKMSETIAENKDILIIKEDNTQCDSTSPTEEIEQQVISSEENISEDVLPKSIEKLEKKEVISKSELIHTSDDETVTSPKKNSQEDKSLGDVNERLHEENEVHISNEKIDVDETAMPEYHDVATNREVIEPKEQHKSLVLAGGDVSEHHAVETNSEDTEPKKEEHESSVIAGKDALEQHKGEVELEKVETKEVLESIDDKIVISPKTDISTGSSSGEGDASEYHDVETNGEDTKPKREQHKSPVIVGRDALEQHKGEFKPEKAETKKELDTQAEPSECESSKSIDDKIVMSPKKDFCTASPSGDENLHVSSLLHEEIEKALDKKDALARSRPSSSCSGRIKHDDRILPGVVSRPHTPIEADILAAGDSKCESEGLSGSDVTSILKDLLDDALDKQDDVGTKSRPQSSGSGRISHDDRIVPGALSRSQSPDDN